MVDLALRNSKSLAQLIENPADWESGGSEPPSECRQLLAVIIVHRRHPLIPKLYCPVHDSWLVPASSRLRVRRAREPLGAEEVRTG